MFLRPFVIYRHTHAIKFNHKLLLSNAIHRYDILLWLIFKIIEMLYKYRELLSIALLWLAFFFIDQIGDYDRMSIAGYVIDV